MKAHLQFVLIAAWLGCAVLPVTEARGRAVEVRVLAAEIAPGEPVRVIVDSPERARRVRGEFLGRSVTFEMFGAGDDGELWSGWSMVGLDQEPGLYEMSVWVTRRDGKISIGATTFRVEPREFPSESIQVEQRFVTPPSSVQSRITRERERLNRIYARRGPAPARLLEPFERPVPGASTSIFGTRRLMNGKPRSPHAGIDLRADTGTPVVAPGHGEVVLAQDLYYAGNTVILDHGGGLFSILAHLSRIDVEVGTTVPAGTVVGLSGATGRVTGPHLHWGAKIGDEPFNPLSLLDPALFEAAPIDDTDEAALF